MILLLAHFIQYGTAGEKKKKKRFGGFLFSSAAVESLFRLLVQFIFLVGIILPDDKVLKSVHNLHLSASSHDSACWDQSVSGIDKILQAHNYRGILESEIHALNILDFSLKNIWQIFVRMGGIFALVFPEKTCASS